jgi:hypothetical protein
MDAHSDVNYMLKSIMGNEREQSGGYKRDFGRDYFRLNVEVSPCFYILMRYTPE